MSGSAACGCGDGGAWYLLQPLTRLCGLVSAVLLSGAGAELTVLGHSIASLVIVGALVVFVLETLWVAALFVDVAGRRGSYSRALRCWDVARALCRRLRAPLYVCAATALLITRPTPLTTAAGALLLTTGALRAATPLSPLAPRAPRAGSSLLARLDSTDVYFDAAPASFEPDCVDRCEELTVLDAGTRKTSASAALLEL